MRVLITGTSHAATLRRAFPALKAAHPGMTLEFWGLPGAAFQKASVGPDGVLRPDPADALGARKAAEWNGAEAVDLAPYDRIFLVGLRYGLGTLFPALRDLHPVEWGRRKGARPVALGLLRAAMEAETRAAVTAQAQRTPFDPRFVLMPAPYPAQEVTRSASSHFEPLTRQVAGLAEAGALMAMFESALVAAHAAAGVTLVLQPRETLAAPFLTRDAFIDAAERDARHMNADYGQIAFDALMAATPIPKPGQGAVPATAPLT